jgi:uncharacterized protein (TIGR02996 family)
MTTEEDFLRAILDDINDAWRRLVFADWLEERGDPRAEWLRIDCELARPGLKDDRRPALEARQRQLEEAHRESLIVWERRFALARIKDKVVRAPEEDAPCWLEKGARHPRVARHKGRLNPVLSEEELVAFERQYRITLPEEYRTFLREVGNGGLGPGDGLSPLAEAAEHSPTPDLDRPFPFSFRLCEEEGARFSEDLRTHSFDEALALQRERRGGLPHYEWAEREYAQPGVIYLATPDDPYASVYLVITGEDRGLVWCFGHIDCGWIPEAPTWDEDEKQIGKPPRSFFRWYEDWLDVILSKENGGEGE